ncbi:MAG: hypothetical protein ACRD2U_08130 [Terriglobales bacterium]
MTIQPYEVLGVVNPVVGRFLDVKRMIGRTAGIAVTDDEIDEIWTFVAVGAPVEIKAIMLD